MMVSASDAGRMVEASLHEERSHDRLNRELPSRMLPVICTTLPPRQTDNITVDSRMNYYGAFVE